MNGLIAWRMFVHERRRTALATGGILVAILLMFVQIGLYNAVPRGGLLFYDAMPFDIMLTSSAYVSQAQSGSFPRRRLYEAMAVPGVARAAPMYQGSGRWLNSEGSMARDIFIIGYNPDDHVLDVSELDANTEVLRQPDVVLMDDASRPEFGKLEIGRRVEIEQRSVTIGGLYHLGTGFVGLGVGVVSDLNFSRIFSKQGGLSNVNLGLLSLAKDANTDTVAAQLRNLLPQDSRIFTRKEFMEFEINHWRTNTSAGIIFGFGVVVALIVGVVILNQTLSSQVTRQLPQYATLKAIGYTDRQLGGIVITVAALMSTVGYVPAVCLSEVIYWIIREITPLPVEMSMPRLLVVLATAWGMSGLSALIALRILRGADPADLF